ncbi:uncharacterized protein A4U43_UnF3660 [Asparagus officinalis]|uniref:DUF829 domain-containing protein n=1 Tax=Asparagus officinalis TaxID=4686 RepID=A0A1R3L710_ASPOF|nr:uncharacterized protein LOC109827395 [Asparagus officinalis]ONK55408.1 uncharacterized protein A4U43_UnF3660 [Asparagus officinalis]
MWMMWGEGGRFYWGTSEKERRERESNGVVVIFAWLSSQERNLKPFIDLYSSLGWISFVCHSDFLTLFFPDKAASLACGVLNEIVKEVKIRSLPIVFASFSGGPKGCLYKVLQLMEGKCQGQPSLDEYLLVRDCACGQLFDSSPVDFTSDLGTRFVLHPSVLKMSQPPRVVSWMAKAFASGLDTLFISRFEAQRAEYWETLLSSVNVGPILILCSEDDQLAPYPVVSNFAQNLQELGGDVRLLKWKSSPHVGHYKHYPAEYKAAVTELLAKATLHYQQKKKHSPIDQTSGMAGSSRKISESVCCLHKAADSSNNSLRRVAIDPSDHFFLPSSTEYHETKEGGSLVNEQRGGSFQMQGPPTVNANGVLGKILFDVCVPKNIEGWDIKPVASSHRNGPFNPIKCLRRSRL